MNKVLKKLLVMSIKSSQKQQLENKLQTRFSLNTAQYRELFKRSKKLIESIRIQTALEKQIVMKEGVKFPDINSRKNSSNTSTQQQFEAQIPISLQQTQINKNSKLNSTLVINTDQKEFMNTQTAAIIDPKYDQSQIYQWEESYKKRQQNINNAAFIKNYNDAEPERPRQLHVQRQKQGGVFPNEQQSFNRGEGGYQSIRNDQNQEINSKAQTIYSSQKDALFLENTQENYKADNESDDSESECQHMSKITHSNIQINYSVKNDLQSHPLEYQNKNYNEPQKINLIPSQTNKQLNSDRSHNINSNIQLNVKGDQNQNAYNLQENSQMKRSGKYNPNEKVENENCKYDENQVNQYDKQQGQDQDEDNQDDSDNDEDGECMEDEYDQDQEDDSKSQQDDDDDEQDEYNEEGEYPFLVLRDLVDVKRNIKQQKRIIVDLAFTRYDVVKDVCDEVFGWQIQANANNRTDYNIQWIDSYVHEDDFRRMLPFQKINHFPGSQQLGKKNLLGQNLQKMRNIFPQNYNFYPITWVLPLQYEDLRMYHNQNLKKKPYYIVKPEASCQGRGIYLTNKINQLQNQDHYIVQQYIKNPFLIDNLKFDLRLYVLIKSISPLKIFLFQEGLARFATVPYKQPQKNNIENLLMHLTNYALNKKSPDFVQNEDSEDDDIGHKRSFSSVLKHLYNQGHDVETLLMEIRQIIVKTIISAQPQMTHLYKTCQPKNEMNEMCFEVLGFDIMVDEDLKPYLIEVNHTPSFWTDSPLDLQVKKNLIIDTLNLINITNKTKKKYYEMRVQQQIQSRSLFRKKYGSVLNTGNEELDEETVQQEFFEWEERNMGAYMRIYPSNDDPLNYSQFLSASGSSVQDTMQRKRRLQGYQDNSSNQNIFINDQHQQQLQYQLNGSYNINPNSNTNHQYSQKQSTGVIVSSRNQQEYYDQASEFSQNHQKAKFNNQQTNNMHANTQQLSSLTPLKYNSQLPNAQPQQQQQYQTVNQNIYYSNGIQANNQHKNIQAVPLGSNITPGKLRSSLKGNGINGQNHLTNYQITGSSYQNSSAKKVQNRKPHEKQYHTNQQSQQQTSFIFLDEVEGISNFTFAEPSKPVVVTMESPSQGIKGKKNDNGAMIFQQKSLILNQQPKNINGLKLQPVDQTRNNQNNSMNQGTIIRKDSQEPKKNRIASSQSFHQSSANHTLNSTNQSNQNNSNINTTNTVQNEKVELEKTKKTLNNISILENSIVNQINISSKSGPPGTKNQNSNTSFKKDQQQSTSSKDDDHDEYQYKKSLKSNQAIQNQKKQNGIIQEIKNLHNNSFNAGSNNQVQQIQHHRAISLVSDKHANQIQKVIKDDIYPHNIQTNLKRLNSQLHNQSTENTQQSGISQLVQNSKIEDNIYFPFGSPGIQKIRNKSAINPVMVAAYSSNNNNTGYLKQGGNTYGHNSNSPPVILPNVVVNNPTNQNNLNNQNKKQENVNNIVPKQMEESIRKK